MTGDLATYGGSAGILVGLDHSRAGAAALLTELGTVCSCRPETSSSGPRLVFRVFTLAGDLGAKLANAAPQPPSPPWSLHIWNHRRAQAGEQEARWRGLTRSPVKPGSPGPAGWPRRWEACT